MDDYITVRQIFRTQIEVIHSFAMEKAGESYDIYNKREMEAISMRITTQMLNESARRAGLPINNTSLLNYIKNDGTGNTLLDALNKKKETVATTAQKSNYEKIDKEADQLTQSAQALLQNDENGLFEQAKASGDNQNVYDSIENLFDSYNSTLKVLRNTSNTMNDFYRQMLLEAPEGAKDSLAGVGITFVKDGTVTVDMKKVKATDFATLESLFGKESDFVNKVEFLATRISDNAEANVESLSSTYNAGGNLYSAMNSSKYDFLG